MKTFKEFYELRDDEELHTTNVVVHLTEEETKQIMEDRENLIRSIHNIDKVDVVDVVSVVRNPDMDHRHDEVEGFEDAPMGRGYIITTIIKK